MANEITIASSLTAKNGSLTVTQEANTRADQTNKGGVQKIQNIGTSEEVVSLTGVTAARAILIKNLDATNFVDIGPESGGAMVGFARLKAGENCMLPLKPSVVVRAKADTAAVDIEYTVIET
jgi:hypothetical protein